MSFFLYVLLVASTLASSADARRARPAVCGPPGCRGFHVEVTRSLILREGERRSGYESSVRGNET